MKPNLYFISLIFFSFFSYSLQEYYYEPSQVIDYFNEQNLSKEDKDSILEYISKTFSESYAFNEIAKNPPQPDFDSKYHTSVDIQKQLKEINTENLTNYDFYRKISLVLADLKDGHVRMFWNKFKFQEFFIRAPIEFYIQEYGEEKRIYGECAENDIISLFLNADDIEEICGSYSDYPISSINDMDPFEWINNFGGNFVSTKNPQATFSFKLRYHNQVSLGDYPFSLEELKNFKVEFEDEEGGSVSFETDYIISSDIDIEKSKLRNLEFNNNKNYNKFKHKHENNKRKSKIRKLETVIDWDYQYKDDLKCIFDKQNNLNVYYISSFWAENMIKYKETLINCYKLFDNNTYPIVVVNDLNNGGYISFSQLFLGILSPLMPIDLYKGRFRITDNFKNTENITEFLNTNFTNIDNCKSENFEDLTKNKITVDHGNNIKEELSKLFFISNDTIHDEITKIRSEMKNKRKPTDIIIFTDGYTLSSAAFLVKYLQKNGGGIVVGYSGNPQNNNLFFDSGQSASPLFNSEILKIFSENYNKLVEKYNIELEMPGIQSFYDNANNNIPIEYSVTPVDEKADIYEPFDELSYDSFLDVSKEILGRYKTQCNLNNTNLIKIDENCTFANSYTHGGYLCQEDGTWGTKCVASYCDDGYIFDKNKNECVIDVCSDKYKPEPDDKGSSSLVVVIIILACLVIVLCIICIVCFLRRRRKSSSPEIENLGDYQMYGI